MPKSSKKQIDEDDKKLLKVLETSSGDNIENIAKKCGFSRQKVWRIKKRLEKDNTIWGYNAVFDDEKLDLNRYLILIKRKNKPLTEMQLNIITSRKVKQVSSKLGINIECSFYIHGSYDWFIMVTAKNIRFVKKVIDVFTILLKGFISEVQVEEVIFVVEKNNFNNPNLNKIREFFISE
ncbi:MAG: Lrp/AsnC family transcriptional regulator [Thermoplasmatales archaeon]|nr:MAG: Lrp/AsnC family transcriptional regulator [Thermoplasmatales archaeon]